jgi:microcystin-dependent protein
MRIDIEITPRAKQAITWFMLPLAVFVGTITIAHATLNPDPNTWAQPHQEVSASALRSNLTSLDTRLAALEDVKMKLPAGTVVAYAGPVVPAGWLLCDGVVKKVTDFPDLFQAIGRVHGVGDNTTTFMLPDYRGRFLRGVDDNIAMRDADHSTRTASNVGGNIGDMVGSVQGAQFKAHSHNVQDLGHSHTVPLTLCQGTSLASGPVQYATGTGGCTAAIASSTNVANISQDQGGGGSETRPANAYVNFIIKT